MSLMMMRLSVMLGLLGSAEALMAQSPEAGRIDRQGNRAVLIVDGPRPVDSAAIIIATEFGIAISVEDPPYVFQGDLKDVTSEVSRVANPSRRILIPKGGRLEIPFALNAEGMPQDLAGFVRDLVTAANALLPFAYRIDTEGTRVTLVPTKTRDVLGQLTEVTPLLDRRVTIPPGTRSILATAALMAEALSAQTGLRVSCCQAGVAGIPWGMEHVQFEANDEPARNVLQRLIAATGPGPSDRTYWLLRCDSQPSSWCFINLAFTHREALVRENPPVETTQPNRWFNPTPVKP